MGIGRALKLLESGAQLDNVTPIRSTTRTRISSPWQSGSLSGILAADVWGESTSQISRAQAMSIPSFVKGRGTLISQIAPAPLRAYGTEWRPVKLYDPATRTIVEDWTQELEEQPSWISRTDGELSPHLRMLWTLDDIICSGFSLWGRTYDGAGKMEHAQRIPMEWWHFDGDGKIIVLDEEISEEEALLITGPSEGFLEYANRSMLGAVELEASWIKRARNVIPLVELHDTSAEGMEDENGPAQLISDYIAGREDPNGAVTYTPHNIELRVHGDKAPQVAIEARNFAKIDTANFLMLPAAALDGSLSTSTLTYSTGQDKRNEIADYSLSYWSDPIAGRFSQDDVTPAGTRIRFDFSSLRTITPPASGPSVKD